MKFYYMAKLDYLDHCVEFNNINEAINHEERFKQFFNPVSSHIENQYNQVYDAATNSFKDVITLSIMIPAPINKPKPLIQEIIEFWNFSFGSKYPYLDDYHDIVASYSGNLPIKEEDKLYSILGAYNHRYVTIIHNIHSYNTLDKTAEKIKKELVAFTQNKQDPAWCLFAHNDQIIMISTYVDKMSCTDVIEKLKRHKKLLAMI